MIATGQKYLLKDGMTIAEITKVTEKSVGLVYDFICNCGIEGCRKKTKATISKEQLKLYTLVVKND
jgi:hypothetical protein